MARAEALLNFLPQMVHVCEEARPVEEDRFTCGVDDDEGAGGGALVGVVGADETGVEPLTCSGTGLRASVRLGGTGDVGSGIGLVGRETGCPTVAVAVVLGSTAGGGER